MFTGTVNALAANTNCNANAAQKIKRTNLPAFNGSGNNGFEFEFKEFMMLGI